MKKAAIKLGLIGLGKMEQNHLRVLSILKSADLRFIYNADTQSRPAIVTSLHVRAVNVASER